MEDVIFLSYVGPVHIPTHRRLISFDESCEIIHSFVRWSLPSVTDLFLFCQHAFGFRIQIIIQYMSSSWYTVGCLVRWLCKSAFTGRNADPSSGHCGNLLR